MQQSVPPIGGGVPRMGLGAAPRARTELEKRGPITRKPPQRFGQRLRVFWGDHHTGAVPLHELGGLPARAHDDRPAGRHRLEHL